LRTRRTSSAVRTKETAIASAPFLRANSRSCESFLGERGDADGNAGKIDAFVFAEQAAVDDFADYIVAVDFVDAEFEQAVGEQDAGALLNVFSEGFEGGADEGGGPLNFAGGDGEAAAGLEENRDVVFELGGTDLGALQIGEDTERLALFAADLADHLDEGQLLFVGSVREVEANDVDAGTNEVSEDGLGVGGGSESGDDFCTALRRGIAKTVFRVGHGIAPKRFKRL
jgi:hypothetical protein